MKKNKLMNQIQIINRHGTWQDEKKDENKQDPVDKKAFYLSYEAAIYSTLLI